MSTRKSLGMVVNYFHNGASEDRRKLLVATTCLSLRLLKMTPCVGTVVLADGSREPDCEMRDFCLGNGIQYQHFGKQVGYAEAYNLGWRSLDEPYIGLMANDIIPHPIETMEILLEWIAKPDIGCVAPYFHTARVPRDETQRMGYWNRSQQTCEPASITLNLNLFKRSVLEDIGGIEDRYLFGYAEPIFILKIRTSGYRVVLVGGTQCYHYGELTKSLGVSDLKKELYAIDARRWREEYAPYASRRGIAGIKLWKWPFAVTLPSKALWWMSSCTPWVLRSRLLKLVMWLEPFLTRYPTRHGKARRRRG